MKNFKVFILIFCSLLLVCVSTPSKKTAVYQPDLNKTKRYRSEDIIKKSLVKILPDLIERTKHTDINVMKNKSIPGHFEISPGGKIRNVQFGTDGIWSEHFIGAMLDKDFKEIGHDGLVTIVDFVLNQIEKLPYFSIRIITLSYEATTRHHVFNAVFKKQTDLQYAYHKRLKVKKDLKGSITVKIGIDNIGRVVFSDIAESSMNDTEFENEVERITKRWNFEELKRETNDTIDINFPVIFSR